MNTGAITLTPTAGFLYSLDGAAYAAYPAGGYTGLAAGSTHTVSEQNAAGCNSTNSTVTIGPYPAGEMPGLVAGSTHTLTAQNAAGCSATSASVTIRCGTTSCTQLRQHLRKLIQRLYR